MKPSPLRLNADAFIVGTLSLSQAEVGTFIRLLCHQWQTGAIPSDTWKLERVAGGPVSADVLAMFPLGTDLLRRNIELEQQRPKKKAQVIRSVEVDK